MQTISLQIELPADLPSLLRYSQKQLQQILPQWIALELFRQRHVSAGRAAQIANLTLEQFMALTHQHDLNWLDYTEEELQTELQESVILGQSIRP